MYNICSTLEEFIMLSEPNNIIKENYHIPEMHQLICNHFNFKNPRNLNLLNVISYQQTEEYTCGPSAVMSLLNYHNVIKTSDLNKQTELRIAKEMGTSLKVGTSPKQIEEWCLRQGFDVNSSIDGTIDQLKQNIHAQIPTLVEWIDWGGHWALVIGYYENLILLADPISKESCFNSINGIICVTEDRFESMWFDAQYFKPGQIVRGIHINVQIRIKNVE